MYLRSTSQKPEYGFAQREAAAFSWSALYSICECAKILAKLTAKLTIRYAKPHAQLLWAPPHTLFSGGFAPNPQQGAVLLDPAG